MADTSVDHPKMMGDYTVIKKLGQGSYGSVYLVELNGVKYAIKQFDIEQPENLASLVEIDLEMRLRHPRIVRGIEVFRDSTHLYFVQQLADNSLSGYLQEYRLNIHTKVRLIYELGLALHYLLHIGVIHCDIKPDNILILNDRILVADLGLAAYIDSDISHCETPTHRAPEFLMNNKRYVKKLSEKYLKFAYDNEYERKRTYTQGEIWSYGMTCLDILFNTNSVIFDTIGNKILNLVSRFQTPKSTEKLLLRKLGPLPDDHLPVLRMILDKMLTIDLDRRCRTFEEILHSDTFTDYGFSMGVYLGNIQRRELDTPIPQKHRPYFVILNNWIIEVLRTFKVTNRVAFLALALVRGLWNKRHKRVKEVQLFGCACVYLAIMVITGNANIDSLVWISDNNYTKKEIFDYALQMLIDENGYVSVPTLYDYLSSLEMLQKAITGIYDPHRTYQWSVWSTKRIADLIMFEETTWEADHRSLKDSVRFNDLILIIEDDDPLNV
jgi:serine/threonine protein kinase